MKLLRLLPLGLFLALAWASDAAAEGQPYGWSLSSSLTDPYANGGILPGGPTQLYLWLVCCNVPDYPDGSPRQQGFTTVRFRLDLTGIIFLGSSFPCISLPLNPPDFWLSCPGCPCGPVVVGEVMVMAVEWGASICFAPNSVSGDMATLDCESEPTAWGMDWIGYGVNTSPPCGTGPLCQAPVSTDAPGWGRVKALYR